MAGCQTPTQLLSHSPSLAKQEKERACCSMGSSWATNSSRACPPAPQQSSIGCRNILLQHLDHLLPLLFPDSRVHRAASQLLFTACTFFHPFLSLNSLKCPRHGWGAQTHPGPIKLAEIQTGVALAAPQSLCCRHCQHLGTSCRMLSLERG